MDVTQSVILSVIIVLSIFLVIIGVQAFFVLKDLRKTLKKMDSLIEDSQDLIVNIKKPIESASNVFTAVTTGAGIAHFVKKLTKGDSDERK